ncbi:MAG: putative heme d1 biosynthesis radical SAM protein NirJ2 [bacterium]|nr:putative heme d1 biosynthesis radical SAM protein NirJ2 [bacterium]
MLISWNTTWVCNLRCRHCYRDAGKKAKDELSTSEGKLLLEEIGGSGFKRIVFSGGEPLLRKDIYELVRYAKDLGLDSVFGTNGTLISPEVARMLKLAGATRIGISLDSLRENIHDDFRQVKGAYRKAISGMKSCKMVGLEFQIHTTVMEFNYDEIEEISNFSERIGAEAYHIFFLIPTGRARDYQYSKRGVQQWAKMYESLLQRILIKQKEIDIELKPTCAPQFVRQALQMNIPIRFKKGCLAGISYCCILPNGDVHPCPYLPINAGNIREKGFKEIWEEADILLKLRSRNYKGKCGRCDYKESCGGCRARAYFYSEDYMGEDPFCLYNG